MFLGEYTIDQELIVTYMKFLAIVLGVTSLGEFLFPHRAFTLWYWWLHSPFFRLHGLIVLLGGFPLTIYEGTWSLPIFICGLAAVIMGPVILLYPEKMAHIFDEIRETKSVPEIKGVMYFDASVRLLLALVLYLAPIF